MKTVFKLVRVITKKRFNYDLESNDVRRMYGNHI